MLVLSHVTANTECKNVYLCNANQSYSYLGVFAGNLALGGNSKNPSPASLLGGSRPAPAAPVSAAAPMAARGNAAVEKKSAKSDPFGDLLG